MILPEGFRGYWSSHTGWKAFSGFVLSILGHVITEYAYAINKVDLVYFSKKL